MKRFVPISSPCPLTRLIKFWCIFVDPSYIQRQCTRNEWSEKDLARSVHRAEQTFQGGEMSRRTDCLLIWSAAGDRAFLHYRFGATGTCMSQRLNEAIEH